MVIGEIRLIRENIIKNQCKIKSQFKKCKGRTVSVLLAAVMTLTLAGCVRVEENTAGAGNTGAATVGTGAESTGGIAGAQEQDETGVPMSTDGLNVMGRYVEQEIDLSEQLWNPRSMCMLDDGSIAIIDAGGGIFVSRDKGSTWIDETADWYDAMHKEHLYIGEAAMASDGTAAVVYDAISGNDSYDPLAKLILPDGTEVPVEIDFTGDDKYIRQVIAGDDGRIFAQTFESIYEIHSDGSGEKILTPEDSSWIWAQGNLLFIDSDGRGLTLPVIYDMDAKEYVEDEVLIDFVNETYPDRIYNGTNDSTMQLLPGAGGTVYIVGSKGIQRHVLGGNMVEQIVDGNLSLLSNPSYTLISALQLEDDVFLALCANGRVIRFTYDPNIPTVPENMLTIYSLREDDNIRQAVSYYQTLHPDWFVSYRIGMSDSDSVTREDAIKKLNTEIMAGTGPDLIVLDDLPIKSYVSKGLLLDLTDYLAEYRGEEPLFDNVIDAVKIDGKAYAVPAVVSIPVIAAPETYTMDMTDLSGIADAIDRMREDYPTDNLTGMINTGEVLKRFASTSEPAWIKEDGTLDMDSIRAYLEQCKRIYAAQMNGMNEKSMTKLVERYEYLASYEGIDLARMDWGAGFGITDYISGGQHMLSGFIDSTWSLGEMLSLEKAPGYEDTGVIPMQGQCSQVFMPGTMLGISAASVKTDAATMFMDIFLSADVQSSYYGYPLNQAAFDTQFTKEGLGPDNSMGAIAAASEEGMEITLEVYWASDEQIAEFRERLATVNTAYIPDSVLEEAVFSNGGFYLSGERSMEDTLSAIEKAVTLYLAE